MVPRAGVIVCLKRHIYTGDLVSTVVSLATTKNSIKKYAGNQTEPRIKLLVLKFLNETLCPQPVSTL